MNILKTTLHPLYFISDLQGKRGRGKKTELYYTLFFLFLSSSLSYHISPYGVCQSLLIREYAPLIIANN